MLFKFLLLLLFVSSCCTPRTEAYREAYAYLDTHPSSEPFFETPYYLVIFVNARHLDYTNGDSFLSTCLKHPSDGSKNGDVGHAWLYLKGPSGVITGGQSGETGRDQPRYLDGILDNMRLGAKDPVRYLWCSQSDGYFEAGSGGHKPTFAAKIDLTEEQHAAIVDYIRRYDFREYNLVSHQCTTFVKGAAALAGLDLEDKVDLHLPQTIRFRGRAYPLYESDEYAVLSCGSPDRLERSLYEAVLQGKAQNVTREFK